MDFWEKSLREPEHGDDGNVTMEAANSPSPQVEKNGVSVYIMKN